MPGRLLPTVTRKPTVSPAVTGLASAVLAIVRPGHCTVVDASLVNGPPFSLLTDTDAVFCSVVQSRLVVALVMCTVYDARGASVPMAQPRVWLPLRPVMLHAVPL